VTHAYYLAVEGGTNATSGVTVVGLGRERRALVEQIFYRALAHLVPADATFSMARAATLQSARDLSNDDGVLQAVAAAWSAVGVE
jgi:Zn-dependent metalloprotease